MANQVLPMANQVLPMANQVLPMANAPGLSVFDDNSMLVHTH